MIRMLGAAYAYLLDRTLFHRHGVQRYGTLWHEIDGETVLAPLDGLAADADRARLGLPSLEAVQERILAANRRRAEALWATQGLPPGAAVRRVAPPWTVEDLLSRWRTEGRPVWSDRDYITFVHQAEAGEVWVLGGIQKTMWRVDETGLWVLTVRVRDLQRAAIRYTFAPAGRGELPHHIPAPLGEWRGPQAPLPPVQADPLKGRLRTFSLESTCLGEPRGVTVYLPHGHDPARPVPVVYLADGQSIEPYARLLEPVLERELGPILLVGVHSLPDPGRSQEYLPGESRDRFERHRCFFAEEVRTWAEATLGASMQREHRAVFGASNGGRFAVEMGLRHPDIYGTVLAFSVAGGVPRRLFRRRSCPAPRFYLVAGTLEEWFYQNTVRLATSLRAAGFDCRFVERVTGHDALLWEEEFPSAVRHAFGG